jgi:uncharacterized protein (TIGR00369 family)
MSHHESPLSSEEKAALLINRLKMGFEAAPFVKLMGLEITHADGETVRAEFPMKPELIGNVMQQILHGGVLAAALDTVSGAMGYIGIYQHMKNQGLSREERYERIAKLGTVDMRVDYLRPGRGEKFIVTATVLRVGKKIFVSRSDVHNEKGHHIATATATYLY